MSTFEWKDFDPATVPTPSRDPVPAGEYVAVITDSAMKDNKAGTGQYLALSFQIAEGDHEGRFVWDNLNLIHPNEKAVQIAKAALAALCKAVGVLSPKDSADLHGKPVVIRVALEQDRDGNARNAVKSYKPVGTQAPAAPQLKPAAPTAKPANSVPPWKKK